MEKVEKKKK